MHRPRLIRSAPPALWLTLLLLGGAWLLARPARPRPESPTRPQLLASLHSTAGRDSPAAAVSHPPARPVIVRLADLPAGPAGPDHWREEEGDAILPPAVAAARQADSLARPPDQGLQLADQAGAGPSPLPTGVHFDSLDFNTCCGGSGGVVPPDPDMAAGAKYLIVSVNLAFTIYNKNGAPVFGPFTFASLFSSLPECASGLFDPRVLYDEVTHRFVFTIDAGGTLLCVAAAQSSDPFVFALYAFPAAPPGRYFDFPQAGIGREALYVSGNLFDVTGPAPVYLESRLWAISKDDLYAGQPAAAVERGASGFFTPQPIHLHGFNHGTWPAAGTPHYFFGMLDFDNGEGFGLIAWHDPFDADTLSFLPVDWNWETGAPGYPVDAPQFAGQNLQANDWRPLDFEYRNGYGWATHHVACNPGAGAVNCLRWAQVRLSTGQIINAGLYASDGEHRFYPDLAANHCGDMAIGYTKTSNAMFPAIYVTGRQSADARGQLAAEALLKAGELPYVTTIPSDPPPYRWGDYTGMTIDPDGYTFWYVGQYSKDTATLEGRWGTYVGAFTYPDCSAPPPALPPRLYLPGVVSGPPRPAAGLWQHPPSHEFYVTAAGEAVYDVAITFIIPDCGAFKVVNQATVPIVERLFTVGGSVYATGHFRTATEAVGFDGLDNLYVAPCDVTVSGGPFYWHSAWQNGQQAAQPITIVAGPPLIQTAPDAAGLLLIPLPFGEAGP